MYQERAAVWRMNDISHKTEDLIQTGREEGREAETCTYQHARISSGQQEEKRSDTCTCHHARITSQQKRGWNVWREWGESVGRQRKIEMMNGQRAAPVFSSGKARKGVKREVLFDKDYSDFNPVAKSILGG